MNLFSKPSDQVLRPPQAKIAATIVVYGFTTYYRTSYLDLGYILVITLPPPPCPSACPTYALRLYLNILSASTCILYLYSFRSSYLL